MKILYSQLTQTTKPYPRTDEEPIVGLDPDYLVLTQVQTSPPSYDPETQNIASQYVVDLSAGEYRQEWTVSDLPLQPQWDAFNVYMLSDSTFKGYRDTVRSTDPELNTALINAYGRIAESGIGAFAAIWAVWSQVSGITQEDKDAIAAVAASYNLPTDFITTLTS
jgi:hypothetical protein